MQYFPNARHAFDFVSRPLLAVLFSLLAAGMPAAATAAPLEPAVLIEGSDYAAPTLSESGRYLAVLVPVNGEYNVAVIDLETRKVVNRVDMPGVDIRSVQWIGDDNLLFSGDNLGRSLARRSGAGGMFLVSRDGKLKRKVMPTVREWFATGARRYIYYHVVDKAQRQQEEVILSGNANEEFGYDLYRLNVVSGQRVPMTRGRPPRTQDYLLDGAQVPRVAVSEPEGTNERVTWYRDTEKDAWRELWRADMTRGAMTVALHVEGEGDQLIVASNEGRDTMAIFRYDVRTGQRKELLAGHPRFDIGADASGELLGGMVLDPEKRRVVGFHVGGGGAPETIWIDPTYQRLQALVDGALPGMRNVFSRSLGSRTLISSYSDRKPVRWHVLDEQTGQLRALFVSRPWLDKGQLVAMQPVTVKTRDGLDMPAFLFEPARAEGEKVPLVVHIHGGPWVQAEAWGPGNSAFREGQLLASRGYAVLVPNFRGTLGLGRKIYQSARGEYGGKMQDDIEDAADWAVTAGLADPKRICLYGSSYGGYSALMGLVKTPDKYRCAVAGLPVTDLEKMMTSGWSDVSSSEQGLRLWKALVGDPATQAAALAEVSPARQAKRIKGAVMLFGSVQDRRVPFEQMELMRDALRANGKDPKWIAKYGEGHGIYDTDSMIEIYGSQFEFLKEHLSAPRP